MCFNRKCNNNNYKLKKRLILIITGKGERNYNSEDSFSNKGVLRKMKVDQHIEPFLTINISIKIIYYLPMRFLKYWIKIECIFFNLIKILFQLIKK